MVKTIIHDYLSMDESSIGSRNQSGSFSASHLPSLWKSGEDVCDMEHGSIPHTASARFLATATDGTQQLKVDPRSCIDKRFRRFVNETRTFLKKNPQKSSFDTTTSESLEHAARIAEEAFVSPQSSVVSEPLIL